MMFYLVTYDVSDPRALRRTAKLLNTFGTRVQKSVFECHLTASQFAHLRRRIEEERDRAPAGTPYSVRCYRLGQFPPERLVIVGEGEHTTLSPHLIV